MDCCTTSSPVLKHTLLVFLKNRLQVFFPLFISNLWPIQLCPPFLFLHFMSLPCSESSSGYPSCLKSRSSFLTRLMQYLPWSVPACSPVSSDVGPLFPHCALAVLTDLRSLNKPNFSLLLHMLFFEPRNILTLTPFSFTLFGSQLKNHLLGEASLSFLSEVSLPLCPLHYSPSLFVSQGHLSQFAMFVFYLLLVFVSTSLAVL